MNSSAYPVSTRAEWNLEQLASFMLAAFVFCVPWEEQPIGGFSNGAAASRVCGILAFAICAMRVLLRFKLRRLAGSHYAMVAFVVWACITSAWTLAPELTSSRIVTYVQLTLMAWLGWECITTPQRQRLVMGSYVLGACVPAFGTIFNFLLGREAVSRGIGGKQHTADAVAGRYAATGFDENELSLIVALSIPMSAYLLVSTHKRMIRLLCAIHLGIAVISILLTGSRGGMLSTFLALLAVPLMAGRLSIREKLAGLGGVAVMGALTLYTLPEATLQRLLSTSSELAGGTMAKRTFIWEAGWRVFQDHAFLGVGAGAYPEAVRPFLDVAYVAHNSFLSILVETGLVGALLFTVWIVAVSCGIWRLDSLERKLWTIALLTWSIGVSSITWEHRKPTWLLFTLIAAAAGLPKPPHRVSQTTRASRARR